MQLRTLEPFRFLLSLTILVWHYQHFFMGQSVDPSRFQVRHQPFFETLKILYLRGDFAVMLFWAVSGVVFAHVYGERVRRREVGLWEFATNRLARLYPLHLVTLLVVAGLDLLFVAQSRALFGHGRSFIYQGNDLFHFFLNLVMASHWGFQDGFSFNGPFWSVSVEVLAYLGFFGVALWMRLSIGISAALFLVFVLLTRFTWLPMSPDIAQCFAFFFGGVFVHALARWIAQRPRDAWSRAIDVGIGLLALHCVVAIVDFYYFRGAMLIAIRDVFHTANAYLPFADWIFANAVRHWSVLIFAPVCVLALLRLEERGGDRVPQAGLYLGKLTYSMYLWHFPLQLLTVLVLDRLEIGRTMFRSPVTLFAFIGAVIAVSHLSYRWIEAPARAWVRARTAPADPLISS